VIHSFSDQGTADIFEGRNTKASRKTCSSTLWKIAYRKLDMLDSAAELNDLKVTPGNRLEPLTGDREGQYSIRINDQYRICFTWAASGPDQVEITDYH
jgi:proteic killer suppression protein